ncbi:MAG: GntR family transcriptional regulator [Elusimicrobiaceae bacterium]|jgi:GntR family transcriptional regulator
MIEMDFNSTVPLYDQLKAGIKGLVAKGLLLPGDQAPSVRSLAVSLKINPNTVARALRELAQEGFLDSRRGGGNYVSESAPALVKDGLAGARADFLESVKLARRGGLPWVEIDGAVAQAKGEEK